ncbi:hypothetical protein ACFL4P_02695, partial [Gemmatimonadota bacterium]
LNLSLEFPTSDSREKIGGQRLIESRLILSRELPHDVNICCNIILDRILENGNETSLSLGMGAKTAISENLEGGIEVMGELDSDSAWEMMAGLYYSMGGRTILKGGFGFGLSDTASDKRLSLQLIIGL